VRLFFYCTRGCGCIEHPAFPAPSIFLKARQILAKLGRVAPRDRGGTFPSAVIARHRVGAFAPPDDRLLRATQYSRDAGD
jgi:hypothetical protein